jgi:ribosomal protein S18 acetylase RimI-like enzyme
MNTPQYPHSGIYQSQPTMTIENYSPGLPAGHVQQEQFATFLERHLERFGDPKEHILKAMTYAMDPTRGGLILVAKEGDRNLGITVINDTRMGGYIPENILVYIAVDPAQRGKGIGRKLMQEAIAQTKGGIALHVEPDNPARRLYESLGFTNKYLEMRLQP